MRRLSGLSWWTPMSGRVHYHGIRGQKRRAEGAVTVEEWAEVRCCQVWRWRKWASRNWKRQGIGFSWGLQKDSPACQKCDFSLVRSEQTANLQKCKIINLCYFKPIDWCYDINRKQIPLATLYHVPYFYLKVC